MKPRIKASDIKKKRSPRGLKRPIDNHWRTNKLEYEYLARMCHGKVIAEETRKLWFTDGWEIKLPRLRKIQREQGISDIDFMHPQERRELFKAQKRAA